MIHKPINVMLCDDSAVMRRLIKRALESDARINVVAEARNGQHAMEQLESANPDIVILDVEMPIMDGIDTVKAIRKVNQQLPIIMFSSLTSRGAEATLDAMREGASDFSTKPTSLGHIDNALQQVRGDLIPKILDWTNQAPTAIPAVADVLAESKTKPTIGSHSVDLIAIGVSTGGPEALLKVLSACSPELPVPMVIVQHMPPVFTAMLAQRLSQQTGHQVIEATDGCELDTTNILIAPGNYHMTVQRRGLKLVARLNQDAHEHSCRPAVDPLFRSIASCCGRRSLGVVLTGMGKDGCLGANAIKDAGGSILAQDQSSSVVWGMPGKVVEAGLADDILSLNEIGRAFESLNKSKSPTTAGV